MIMVHSDDKGLVLPPNVAATQVVVIQGETGTQGTGFLVGGTKTVKTVVTARHDVDAV